MSKRKTTQTKATQDKATKTETPEEKTVTVTALARENHIDPKNARAKMRRLYRAEDADLSKLPTPIREGSWTFEAKDEAAILDMIRSAAKAETE